MISAVVVNHNGRRHLQRCLESLEALHDSVGEVIVVDGGSGGVNGHDGDLDTLPLLGGGKWNDETWEYSRKYFRQSARMMFYMGALTSEKPGGPDDNHPVDVLIPKPKKISIIQLLFGGLIMIPQMFIAYFFMIYIMVMWLIGLITGPIMSGKWSEGKFDLVRNFAQHMIGIMAYATWMTDVRPPIVPPGHKIKIKVNVNGGGDYE